MNSLVHAATLRWLPMRLFQTAAATPQILASTDGHERNILQHRDIISLRSRHYVRGPGKCAA
jgi:hypothetical protein